MFCIYRGGTPEGGGDKDEKVSGEHREDQQERALKYASPYGSATARTAWRAAAWGGAAGLAAALWFQVTPRLSLNPSLTFTGAPQGLDQFTYFAMVRAIWRSPNSITYAYPFSLYWATPAVLVQLPLTAIAWIARITGIPLAFEAARILGTAASAAGIVLLARRLVRRRGWRPWFLLALILGGGWFWMRSVADALSVAGLPGMTELWNYHPAAFDGLYHWAPFVAQNITYPLEAVYHGIVFAALAALVWRRERVAMVLGVAAWLSNPFTAVALSAAVVPWWVWSAVRAGGGERARAARNAAGWVLITAAGVAYYGPFLGQWPALKDLSRQYSVPLLPPLSPMQMLLMWGPWIAGIVWSIATPAGRRHVWGRPVWSLFAILALTQMALAQQGWVLGERAVQPPHYNRGYLLVGMVAVFWRAAMAWAPRARRAPWWLAAAVLMTLPDQGLFFLREALHGVQVGFISRGHANALRSADALPAPLVAYAPHGTGSVLAALTNHLPFGIPESMVVPFPAERDAILAHALAAGEDLARIGIQLCVTAHDDPAVPLLEGHGWRRHADCGQWVVLVVPQPDPGAPLPPLGPQP